MGKKIMSVWSEIIVVLMAIMCSGCIGDEPTGGVICTEGDVYEHYWMDSHQWNSAPMSYANMTMFTINNTSMGQLNITLDITAYFSEGDSIFEQGWVNMTIKQNETLWENETSEDVYWDLSLPIDTTQNVTIELTATGKDTHPESDMGDYFVVKINAMTEAPLVCN